MCLSPRAFRVRVGNGLNRNWRQPFSAGVQRHRREVLLQRQRIAFGLPLFHVRVFFFADDGDDPRKDFHLEGMEIPGEQLEAPDRRTQ